MKLAKSKGGPLILMERRLLTSWRGCFTGDGVPSFDDALHPTDYDRACAVSSLEYVSNIPVGNGEALVLAFPPLMGTFIHRGEYLYFIATDYPDEENVSSIDLKHLVWGDSAHYCITSDEVIVFDSATPGKGVDISEGVASHGIQPGKYLVETSTISDSVFANVHRFTIGG